MTKKRVGQEIWLLVLSNLTCPIIRGSVPPLSPQFPFMYIFILLMLQGLYASLAVLELIMSTRMASNSHKDPSVSDSWSIRAPPGLLCNLYKMGVF